MFVVGERIGEIWVWWELITMKAGYSPIDRSEIILHSHPGSPFGDSFLPPPPLALSVGHRVLPPAAEARAGC